MRFGSKRKTFAICFSGYNWECEAKIVNGIINKCTENNIAVLIFSSLLIKGDYPKGIDITRNLVMGESEIFNLINYKLIDGLFLFGGTMYKKESEKKIAKLCDENNIPFVNVHNPSESYAHNVYIEETHAMELMIEHLVTEHGFTRLDFISGYPGNKESEDRLAAYKKVLTRHNIPIDERRIAYGHFWKESIECAKQLLKIDLPEAFICANDTMAIMVSDFLKNEGFSIPHDVVVTGFDGIMDASIYTPSITTIQTDFVRVGECAFNLLYQVVNGNFDVKDEIIYPELLIQESCGCSLTRKRNFNYIDTKYVERFVSDTFHKNLIKTDVYFSDSESSEELFSHLLTEVNFFAFEKFYFCINADFDDKNETRFIENNPEYGIPKRLVSYSFDKNGKLRKDYFESEELCPYEYWKSKSSAVIAFSPLYYKRIYIGYVAYTPAYGEIFRDYFPLWLMNASTVIGSFYVKQELEQIGFQDYMTGLYNRRGMSRIFAFARKKIENSRGYVSMVCSDIDNLKRINDDFGHESGDIAIIQVAKALLQEFGEASPCIRTGGDEFCTLILSDKKPQIDKILKNVDKTLAEFNEHSGLPFRVICSSSYCSVKCSEFKDFDTLRKTADVELYKVKDKHHQSNLINPLPKQH